MEVTLAHLAFLGVGLFFGGLLVWLLLRSRHAALELRLAEAEKTGRQSGALLEEAERKLSDAFKALAAEALRANNQMFLDLARENFARLHQEAKGDLESRQQAIDELVRPLKEALGRVDAAIREMEQTRAAAFGSLSEQVRALAEAQQLLRAETANLVQALRTPAVRGRWGEIQLRRAAELAGMLEHCDFEEQVQTSADAGRLRPDMIVRLPNGRQVVVDAKVPLKAYLEALEATTEADRTAKLKEHAAQLRAHLDRLAAKAYWNQFEPTPEFVVAFVSGEAFFSAALQHDPELLDYGAARRVLLATPTTLIALLLSVAHGWREQRLARNAEEIRNLGRTLHDRLRIFSEHLLRLGRNLEQAVSAFNDAAASLESRVLVSARRFRELGAAAGELPSVESIDVRPRLPED